MTITQPNRAPATASPVARAATRTAAPRLLAGAASGRPLDLAGHERVHGPTPLGQAAGVRPERLIELVERSGLTGRGGAGFPTGRKMRSVLTGKRTAVVVANGAEGEPASAKDHVLLGMAPHLVLDGISLAVHAVQADAAYLAVHRSEQRLIEHLERALAERERAGLDPVAIQLIGIPGRYVSSEQSAIVQFINGGSGKPTYAPPRPHERGVAGRPTLVNNVETLAHLALITRHGDAWFRSAGAPAAPGTTLVTLSGAVARPIVYEVELGASIGEIFQRAGGLAERAVAVLAGGYFGTWIPMEEAWYTPLTRADLRAVGGALGAGILIALPERSCALAETARVVQYLAEETAGQCGPCIFGLPALAEEFSALAFHGGRGRAIGRIERLIGLIEGRGACKHPDGATGLVRSAMKTFAQDAYWHEEDRPCEGVRHAPLLPLPDDRERDWEFQ
ncbi:NADH-ubiquinone oxidoreductase-F iron-sulfur binding region domain-containing protein [Actinocrinis sp.]|uniref:NADH-ubiquinone oxidoreductase-F iron-sulfur binding region domain-containing protein n=1 Tax=Actinocrinis sp. TaxID=1920516 RepID=UPI002D63D8B3|nr:NADH-ubiquinone oxidoreductase-F iron-sulfur binding region domain-containing protein [Actinocrinis sp.]HZP51768.1 NADH-ubiquinone oxidoreductase-F iron-sulfur binding region domain-containing protein [Actinocrinis sp.]